MLKLSGKTRTKPKPCQWQEVIEIRAETNIIEKEVSHKESTTLIAGSVNRQNRRTN